MRTVRNITVAVESELYRQTRKIAAEYDTTVTDMVRFLLLTLPEAVKAARYPGGRPQFGLAAYRRDLAAAGAQPISAPPDPSGPSLPPTPHPAKSEIPPCTPVNTNNQIHNHQLTKQNPSPVQDKYFSIAGLKSIISKVLHTIL
ncbi:MAG: hypothetical protein ABR956_17445 [Terracidiphilus sp.]|jgi:hypothetical protein